MQHCFAFCLLQGWSSHGEEFLAVSDWVLCQVALAGKEIHCLFRGQSKVMWCYCSLFSLRCLKLKVLTEFPQRSVKPSKIDTPYCFSSCDKMLLVSVGIAKHVCIHCGVNTACGCATVATFFKFDLTVFKRMTRKVLMQKTAF